MSDASREWKVEWLKIIRDMPAGAAFMEDKISRQDMIWIRDLERDGYIAAMFRMGYKGETPNSVDFNVPNMIYRVHILDKGRQLILDLEAPPKKQATDWVRVGVWLTLAGVAVAVFIHVSSSFLAK